MKAITINLINKILYYYIFIRKIGLYLNNNNNYTQIKNNRK